MSVEISQVELEKGGQYAQILTRVAIALLALIGWLALLLIVLWLIGRIATDRFYWSQWLWWIPTPAAMTFAAIGLLAASRRAKKSGARRRRVLRWAIGSVALLIYFCAIEHRMLHVRDERPRETLLISIAHWNTTAPPGSVSPDEVANRILDLNADITVLTGAANIAMREPIVAALGNGQQPTGFGTVSVLSRFPILSNRPVLAAHGAFISAVTIDTTEALRRPIVVYIVDMPSDPRIARMALARQLRSLMDARDGFNDSVPPPDVVVGDFNIPRGSASLKHLFPDLRHAFDKAGRGYGATFHRERPFPLYHIDHILLGQSLRAVEYQLINPGIARHRAQKAWLSVR